MKFQSRSANGTGQWCFGLVDQTLSVIYLHVVGYRQFKQPLWDVGMAFGGGILSSFLVLGLIPIFELFNYFVTDFKMLELANLNHPLLRQLMLNAPGTYHHSMTMALLSENSA